MASRKIIVVGLAALVVISCTVLPLPFLANPPSSQGTQSPSGNALTPNSANLSTPSGENQVLNICAGDEPADLFLYSDLTYIKKAILSVINDGPVDMVDYELQPVILTKIPSLENGDAQINPVSVNENDLIMDNSGSLISLHQGVVYRPAGCRNDTCAVTYHGGTVQMDQMHVVFHIRPGVEWSDGAELTAADSVFSFQISTNPEILFGNNGLFSGSATSAMGTESYTALDELSTQWTGLPGFLDSQYQTNFFIPLPGHQLSQYSVSQLMEANEVLYAPLGWGPYQITNWEHGREISFELNPHYFRLAEGLPWFRQVVIHFVGQDFESNLAEFSAGECDLLLQDAVSNPPAQSLQDLVSSGAGNIYLDPANSFEHLTFNISHGDSAHSDLFASFNMRKAVASCIDRNALVQEIFAGLVPPLDLALPADHPLLNGADLSYPFDPETAKNLLEGMGWIDTNGDGIRESHGVEGFPDGTDLSISLITTDSPLRIQSGALISGQLKDCGMQAGVIQVASRDLFTQDSTGILSGRNFDLAETSSDMNIQSLCKLAVTGEISSDLNGWSGSNIGGYSNPSLDTACTQLENNLPGSQGYLTASQTAIRLFSEALPIFPLYYFTGFTLARSDLAGIQTGYGQISELQKIELFKLKK